MTFIFARDAIRLTEKDFEDAAEELHCEVAAIKAVSKVESGGKSGFFKNKKPKILFESRWFHNLTKGRFDKTHPHLSTSRWVRNYYGGTREYERLEEAMKLDLEAAFKSTSWGMFQIMGGNYKLAGYKKVEDFVDAMCISERNHLQAFVKFILGNHLDDELRDLNWRAFARSYNGPGYKKNHYDEKMLQAYNEFSKKTHNRYPTTREIQMTLNKFGANIVVDGITGKNTKDAIRDFQFDHGLQVDGVVGKKTLQALGLYK